MNEINDGSPKSARVGILPAFPLAIMTTYATEVERFYFIFFVSNSPPGSLLESTETGSFRDISVTVLYVLNSPKHTLFFTFLSSIFYMHLKNEKDFNELYLLLCLEL